MAVTTRESKKPRPGSGLRRFFLGFKAAFMGLVFVVGVAWLIGRDDPATAVGLVLFYVMGLFCGGSSSDHCGYRQRTSARNVES